MPWQADLFGSREQTLAANETPRRIVLGDRVIPYVLRRARRRTIGLSIDQRGLRVGAPRRASLVDVESLILRHGDWVKQKLDEWHHRLCQESLAIVDGVRLPMLGESLLIRLAAGNNRALWTEAPGQSAPILTLCLCSPEDAAGLLEKALREKARTLFDMRLGYYAGPLGLAAPRLTLSSARTRWGSCSLKTGIRLNWRLIHFPQHVIDYVVVHELAHLREMNHSPRFWAIVGQIYPDYKTARTELQQLAARCPRW
ncbi:SprT family zinc-dependent metalloprotease [Propionivibrio sp.]|uniref:M48 family metallopeptidase n=1 Tax=Propionivibrio sp. TaxID=2212460 RepID=UPI0025DC7A8F|nr:SprT family zinc-dependent metalloprotease [Propionivibrio sp.]MBK8401324.1 M48 family metallopeptidase [Propionivibrio sp.]MBK8746006.1 M48 family metallopeptidase [Propionivibrio sp.]MBL0208677.1 M48 family metallopeptidase [Propionivibrio sp.]